MQLISLHFYRPTDILLPCHASMRKDRRAKPETIKNGDGTANRGLTGKPYKGRCHPVEQLTGKTGIGMPPALSQSSKRQLPSKAVALDLFERLIVIALFCVFAVNNLRIFWATDLDIRISMLIVSEVLPVILIVGRPPSPSLSQKPFDWVAGLSGTIFPLLVTGTAELRPLVPLMACIAIVLIGLFVQIAAKISLGRSFGLIAANRGVKSQGPYRFVRHPMYAGYTLTHVGLFLSMPSLTNALLYSLALSFQLVRIAREEAVLRQDAKYRAFAEQVRFRLVPGLF